MIWSKEFLEAGKPRLVGDTKREADSHEVEEMRSENEQLKQRVAELTLKNRVLTPALADTLCQGRILAMGVGPERCQRKSLTHEGQERVNDDQSGAPPEE